jgi:hypothetical protein
MTTWGDLAYHGLRVAVPRADEEAVERLVYPDFPDMVKAKSLRLCDVSTDHGPGKITGE